MLEELEAELTKMKLENNKEKFVTFTLNLVEENKKMKLKLEEKEEEVENCGKEVLNLQRMISMTQDRLKLLEQVDEDERVRRIREDREKEMMEIKNDDKIKKLIKEVEGLKEEVEDLEKEVARVKENNIILTCKLTQTQGKLKERENEVMLLVRDAHVMQEDNYDLQSDIGVMMKKMNKMVLQEGQVVLMQQENLQLKSRQRELVEEVEMLQGVVKEAEQVLQDLKTTQQPSSIYSQNSLLLASVHASLGLDCSIDNITHLLNYEEDDDDDNGSNDVTPHNSPLMGEERMKKMKMDLMSEMMGACDDYVQSLESLQQQLQDVTKERDHLKSLVQSRVSMVDRSTSPISTDLSITAANEITTELENELLSLLDQSLTTYQLTCQVAGEKVNCRAIEHVTGRRKDVVERRKKKRSEEQLCVDLFKMAASSCDLVRYSHRVVLRMSKQVASSQDIRTPHHVVRKSSSPRTVSTSSPLKKLPSSPWPAKPKSSTPKEQPPPTSSTPKGQPLNQEAFCKCGATKHLQQLLQAKNQHVSLVGQMVEANRTIYNKTLERIKKNFEEEKIELKKTIEDLETINKQLSSINQPSINQLNIHQSSTQQPNEPHFTNIPLTDPKTTQPYSTYPQTTQLLPTHPQTTLPHPTSQQTHQSLPINFYAHHDSLLKELQETSSKLSCCEKERQTLNNLLLLAIRHKLKLIGLLDQHGISYDLHPHPANNQSTRRNISPRKPMSPRKHWSGSGRSDSGFKPLLYPLKK